MPPLVQRQHPVIRRQRQADEIPAMRLLRRPVQQQNRRIARIAPFQIMKTQPVGGNETVGGFVFLREWHPHPPRRLMQRKP